MAFVFVDAKGHQNHNKKGKTWLAWALTSAKVVAYEGFVKFRIATTPKEKDWIQCIEDEAKLARAMTLMENLEDQEDYL